jgi:hypothetical protein
VVVLVGATVVDPLALLDVKPVGEMLTEVAPVVAQLRVSDAPAAITFWLALNDVMPGTDPPPDAVTVMVSVAVVEPALLVAVSV